MLGVFAATPPPSFCKCNQVHFFSSLSLSLPFSAGHLPYLPATGQGDAAGQVPSPSSANSVTYSSATVQGEATDRDPASFACPVPTSPSTFQGATGQPLALSSAGSVPDLPSHRTRRSRPSTSTSSCALVAPLLHGTSPLPSRLLSRLLIHLQEPAVGS
jgi:hypothetical protein